MHLHRDGVSDLAVGPALSALLRCMSYTGESEGVTGRLCCHCRFRCARFAMRDPVVFRVLEPRFVRLALPPRLQHLREFRRDECGTHKSGWRGIIEAPR